MGLDAGQIARWRAIGVRFIQVVPEVQIHREQDNAPARCGWATGKIA